MALSITCKYSTTLCMELPLPRAMARALAAMVMEKTPPMSWCRATRSITWGCQHPQTPRVFSRTAGARPRGIVVSPADNHSGGGCQSLNVSEDWKGARCKGYALPFRIPANTSLFVRFRDGLRSVNSQRIAWLMSTLIRSRISCLTGRNLDAMFVKNSVTMGVVTLHDWTHCCYS